MREVIINVLLEKEYGYENQKHNCTDMNLEVTVGVCKSIKSY